MKIEDGLTPIHFSRDDFDIELNRAGITLSPFPYEREFKTFEEETDVILYRCIVGKFNPNEENIDWSLNPQHALEYSKDAEGETSALLITQISKEDLVQNVQFYSKQGNKIGLHTSPDPNNIAKTTLFKDRSIMNQDVLRCMRQVITFGCNPNDYMDRGFSSEFEPHELKFNSVLYEWKMAVGMAYFNNPSIPIPPNVIADYNCRRRDSAKIG